MRAYELRNNIQINEAREHEYEKVPTPDKKYTAIVPYDQDEYDELSKGSGWYEGSDLYPNEENFMTDDGWDNESFDEAGYLEAFPVIYIIIDNVSNNRWMWHIDNGEYWDYEGNHIDLKEFVENHKVITFSILKYHGGVEKMVRDDPRNWAPIIGKPTERMVVHSIRNRPDNIKLYDNLPDEIIMKAIEKNAGVILHIDNPTDEMIHQVLTIDGYNIRLLMERGDIKITPEMKLYALKHLANEFVLPYFVESIIGDLSLEAQLYLVNLDPNLANKIENPAPEILSKFDLDAIDQQDRIES